MKLFIGCLWIVLASCITFCTVCWSGAIIWRIVHHSGTNKQSPILHKAPSGWSSCFPALSRSRFCSITFPVSPSLSLDLSPSASIFSSLVSASISVSAFHVTALFLFSPFSVQGRTNSVSKVGSTTIAFFSYMAEFLFFALEVHAGTMKLEPFSQLSLSVTPLLAVEKFARKPQPVLMREKKWVDEE